MKRIELFFSCAFGFVILLFSFLILYQRAASTAKYISEIDINKLSHFLIMNDALNQSDLRDYRFVILKYDQNNQLSLPDFPEKPDLRSGSFLFVIGGSLSNDKKTVKINNHGDLSNFFIKSEDDIVSVYSITGKTLKMPVGLPLKK